MGSLRFGGNPLSTLSPDLNSKFGKNNLILLLHRLVVFVQSNDLILGLEQ